MGNRYKIVWRGVLSGVLILFLLLLGCGPQAEKEGASVKVEPVVIAGALPLGFLYGWDVEKAMLLAAEEINAQGGIDVGGEKRPLKVEILDSRDLEPGVPVSDALLAVEKLILEKKADFFIGGPARSEAALAAMDLMGRHKKVAIFTTGFLSPKFQELVKGDYEKYKYSFRISGSSGNMVQEMLTVFDHFHDEFGFNKTAIIVQDVAHARAGGEIMAQQLQNKGWDVLEPMIYPTGSLDYSDGLFKTRDFGAQVIFIWMDMPESVILLKDYHDMQLPALPIGFICAAEQPDFWGATAGKGEYAIAHLVNAGNAPCEVTPLTKDFVEAYKAMWKTEPEGYGTSSTYQAVYTLVDAIERAGTTEAEAVIDALENTDMVGVYGRIRFDENHQVIPSFDPAEGAVPQLVQWLDGERVTVFPPSIAATELQLPRWMK